MRDAIVGLLSVFWLISFTASHLRSAVGAKIRAMSSVGFSASITSEGLVYNRSPSQRCSTIRAVVGHPNPLALLAVFEICKFAYLAHPAFLTVL